MGENGNGETWVRVKLWSIIILFIGVFGFFFITALAHESRLTKVETTLEVNIQNMTKALDKLSGTIERHIDRN